MDASDINYGGAFTPDDENDFGDCSTCGDSLYYDLCPCCGGDGFNGDGRCDECAGAGEVLFCACYHDALSHVEGESR
jgi:hypothetical protein